MNAFEIVGGVVMMIMCVAISILVLLQEGTKGGGLSALSGGESESFFSRNSGRTREVMLFKATKFCAILFFVATIAVYAAYVYLQ